jgi:hypothetical protein
MDILGIVVVPQSLAVFSNLPLGNRLTQQAVTGFYANEWILVWTESTRLEVSLF